MPKRPHTSADTGTQEETDTSTTTTTSKQVCTLNETAVVLTRPNETGTIRLSIQEVDKLTETSEIRSPSHTIAGLPWRLRISCENSERTQNRLCLSVFAYCNDEAKNDWCCHATVTFRLLSATGSEIKHTLGARLNLYKRGTLCWGFPGFIDMAQLRNVSNPWVRDNKATIEAEITVVEATGALQRPSFSFDQKDETFSDVVLVVEDERLHVNRALLAMYSPFFHSMFFGDFAEARMAEVPIGDIKYDEMVELLGVTYPSHKAINSLNVESMLALGDRFDIQYVRTECEKYLLETQVVALDKKVELADKYNLDLLRTHCVQSMQSAVDIQKLCASPQFADFSGHTKSAILNRLLRVLPPPPPA